VLNYTALALTAKNLIANFGSDVTFLLVENGGYYASTNSFLDSSEVETTLKGVKLNYNLSQVDGEIIKKGDLRLIIEAVSLETNPTVDDKIKFGDDVWEIKSVKILKPANIVLLYDLQLRQ